MCNISTVYIVMAKPCERKIKASDLQICFITFQKETNILIPLTQGVISFVLQVQFI